MISRETNMKRVILVRIAPGEDILSTQLSDSYGTGSGTSYAGPHVAGLAALIRGLNPGLPAFEVRQLIMDTADDIESPGFDELTGHGRLNADRAVAAVEQGRVPPIVDLESPRWFAIVSPSRHKLLAVEGDQCGVVLLGHGGIDRIGAAQARPCRQSRGAVGQDLVHPFRWSIRGVRQNPKVVSAASAGMKRIRLDAGAHRSRGVGKLAVGEAADGCLTARRRSQAKQDLHRCGLARAVWAEKTCHTSGRGYK